MSCWVIRTKNVFMTPNYIEHFLTLVFAVTVSISVSAFMSLVEISKGIMTSTIRLNTCEIVSGIKRYKSIIKKKKKILDEIVLLPKAKSDCIKDLSRSLTYWYIECHYFHENMSNKELSEELHKPVIIKF